MTAQLIEPNQSNKQTETPQAEGRWFDITIIAVFAALAFGFGALIGWLFLAGFVRHFALHFEWNYLASNAWWLTPLALGILNALGSLSKNLAQSRKRDRRQQLGEKIGFELKSHLDVETSDAIDSLFGGSVFHISNALQRNFGTAQMVVCDVQFNSQNRSAPNEGARHTVVFFDDPEIDLPRFQLSPSSLVGRWVGSVLGHQRLNFPKQESFSRTYDLSGSDQEEVHGFFDADLREFFTQNPQWQIHASGKRVVIWRPDWRCDSGDGTAYVDEATLVYSQLRARSVAWMDRPRSEASPAQSPSAKRAISLTACSPVTEADVQALLSTPPPRRRLPRSIQAQKFGFPIVGVVGTMFTMGGAVFASAVFVDWIEVKPGQEWGVGLIGALFLSLGLSMVGGAIHWRWYWSRLLNYGLPAAATIKAVDRTETKINDQRLYWVTAQFMSEAGQTETRMAVYGWGGGIAQRALAENQTLHVLYARKNPRQAVLVEGLIEG